MLIFACASSVFADASLYRGSGVIGTVRTIESSSKYFVDVEDAARLFGINASRSGEELILSRGGQNIRLIAGSAAAWRGMQIVGLSSAPLINDGRFWVDSSSAEMLFQNFAGNGKNEKLRFNQNGSNLFSQTINANISQTQQQVNQSVNPSAQNMKQSVNNYTQNMKQSVNGYAQSVNSSSQNIKQSVNDYTQNINQSANLNNIQTPQQQINNSAIADLNSNSQQTASKSQPKHETFKPGGKKTTKTESYNGTIKRIRWAGPSGNTNKIMAVVDAEDNSNPQVYISGNTIHALFAKSPQNIEGINSPFKNVNVSLNRNNKGVDLVFSSSGFTKIDKLILNNPRRIVFDFYFPNNVKITKNTITPQTQAKTQTVNSSQTRTSQNAASRLKRKTIVIDPGHGGKDPGASANNIIEKNINLAIGLELEKSLTQMGYRVVMTRKTDVYPTLQERTDIANNVNADLFVSIHVNSLPSRKNTSGFEIYIMALPTDKDAMELAKIENREYVEGKGMDVANVDRRTEMLLMILGDMQQNNKISESTDFAAALYNAGSRNGLPMKRIAQAPFFVLRGAAMPAVLLETGFVTNASEAKLLATQNYQKKIADAMASGIVNYLKN